MDLSRFEAVNTTFNADTEPLNTLVLSASPKTDVYATPIPPAQHVYSGPIVYQKIQLSQFKSARVTISLSWTLQFDQGGLIFVIPSSTQPSPDAQNATTESTHPSWVKAGIEVNEGKPYASVVGKPRNGWCDWSLSPLPQAENDGSSSESSITLEMTRYKNALMIWSIGREGEKMLIRKVPWVFLRHANPELGEAEEVAHVGLYAARPDPSDEGHGQKLDVHFTDFDLELTLA